MKHCLFYLLPLYGAVLLFLVIDQINRDFDVSFNLWIASTIGLIVSPHFIYLERLVRSGNW